MGIWHNTCFSAACKERKIQAEIEKAKQAEIEKAEQAEEKKRQAAIKLIHYKNGISGYNRAISIFLNEKFDQKFPKKILPDTQEAANALALIYGDNGHFEQPERLHSLEKMLTNLKEEKDNEMNPSAFEIDKPNLNNHIKYNNVNWDYATTEKKWPNGSIISKKNFNAIYDKSRELYEGIPVLPLLRKSISDIRYEMTEKWLSETIEARNGQGGGKKKTRKRKKIRKRKNIFKRTKKVKKKRKKRHIKKKIKRRRRTKKR